MTIRDSYTYSWFANLSYVNWSDAAWKGAVNAKAAIDDSRNAGRVSGTDSAPIDTLGERIFRDQQWRVLDYQANDSVGFSASLFQKGNSTEKVLAIRGTEGDGVQIALDALRADFGEIGILGMALSQTVSMVNYIIRLRNQVGYNNLMQLHWGFGTAPPSSTLPSITVAPGLKIWLSLTYDGVGLGNLLDPNDKITVTGHSLGGHLAALAIRLFPSLFDNAVTFNAPGFDSDTADLLALYPGLSLLGLGGAALLAAVGPARQLTEQIVNNLFAPLLGPSPAPVNSFASPVLAGRITSLVSEGVPFLFQSAVSNEFVTGKSASPHVIVPIERATHAMNPFMDSLGVHALIEELTVGTNSQAGLDFATTARLMAAVANKTEESEEKILEALSRVLLNNTISLSPPADAGGLPGVVGLGEGDFVRRTENQNRLTAIENKIRADGTLRLVSLVDLSSDDIVSNAYGLTAYRYALRAGNPFVITGNDSIYTALNSSHELDAANNSREYLSDRVGYLLSLIARNLADTGVGNSVVGEKEVGTRYFDATTNTEIVTNPVPNNLSYTRNVIFGTAGSDVGSSIAGSGLPDTIYGDLRFSIAPWDSSAARNSRSPPDAKRVEVATSTRVGRISLARRRWRESEDHRLRAPG